MSPPSDTVSRGIAGGVDNRSQDKKAVNDVFRIALAFTDNLFYKRLEDRMEEAKHGRKPGHVIPPKCPHNYL